MRDANSRRRVPGQFETDRALIGHTTLYKKYIKDSANIVDASFLGPTLTTVTVFHYRVAHFFVAISVAVEF